MQALPRSRGCLAVSFKIYIEVGLVKLHGPLRSLLVENSVEMDSVGKRTYFI